MVFDPTPDQRTALKTIVSWWQKPEPPYITLGGYAGTGKTSLLSAIRHLLARLSPTLVVAFCAYTGKASQVLESTLRLHHARKEKDTVSTIHSLIYAPHVDKQGRILAWKRKSTLKADLIIVDEASMIDRDIWEDLLSFGIPILAVGDHGQLPPIKPGFNLMSRPDIRLETIHRQAAGNPIIQLSMLARENGSVAVGDYGNGVRKLNRYDSSTGSDMESIMQSNRKELLILAGYNMSRVRLNQQMRIYYGFEGEQPQSGDKVICLQNDWEKGIYNGMVGVVKNIKLQMTNDKENQKYEAEIDMEDGILDYSGTILARQFNNPISLSSEVKRKSGIELFDFGYALTVHKAQGSQAKQVLLFEERNKHMSDEDWRRWLYTGITRAEEKLTIVGV
jgi:exodeoxyribonuclease-5